MNRRLLLGLIAGIGVAALPLGVRADGGGSNITLKEKAGTGQTIVIHPTVIIRATTQPGANGIAVTTQPDADAATQPAADASAPATQPNAVMANKSFTITTVNPQQVGPGQVRVLHSTMTITVQGGNIVVQPGPNANPPATQPSPDGNAPATQPTGNGG